MATKGFQHELMQVALTSRERQVRMTKITEITLAPEVLSASQNGSRHSSSTFMQCVESPIVNGLFR
jgi:hypothetical protein